MTAKEIVKFYNKGTADQVDIMHEVTKLLPKLGNDDFSIACLMATAYNAGHAEVEALPDNSGTLGKLPEASKPTEQIGPRAQDMWSLLRHVVGLNDADLRRVYVVARTLAQMEQEAGQQPTDHPKTLIEGVSAMLAKLPAEYQERAYDMVESMYIDWQEAAGDECTTEAARVRRKAHENALKSTANKGVRSELSDDMMFTLKAMVNLEMADVAKPKTLDAILSYVRIVKQREGRE